MTRFARAKGSKSSNEKLPEEATSWSEMKKAMLSKAEKVEEDTSVKNIIRLSKTNQVQEKSSWASLGDDSFGATSCLLNPNFNSSQVESVSLKNKTLKKKKLQNITKDNLNNELDSGVKKIKKAKMEKKKKKALEEADEGTSPKADTAITKKGKKRKVSESNPVDVLKSKKTKVENEKKSVKKINKSDTNKESCEIKNEKPKKLKKKEKSLMGKDNGGSQGKHMKNFSNNSNRKQNRNFKNFEKFGREKFKFGSSKKPEPAPNELIVNGEKIRLIKYQGFYVTFKDAEKLKKLRADMIKEGIPKPKLEAALKLERRRAEKALARLKKSVCFHCRGSGHLLSNCPLLTEKQNTGTGICYKCGSTEHTSFECKVVRDSSFQFAECFICKEQGHIARQCPDNPKGLYPHGGACRICGDVTHLKKDCPQFIEKKADEAITVNVRNDRNLECLDEEVIYREKKKVNNYPKKKSTVKF